jgi:Exocyst complex component Sec10-like, alpha-helical bundle
MHLLSTYINTALIPLASSSLTVRREMTNYCATNISLLEKKVNAIVQVTHESNPPESERLNLSDSEHNVTSTLKTEEK